MKSDRKNPPGILERVPGSGIWWIRWTDAQGKRHLEKAGRRGDAIDLLAKRKHEKLLKKKLPEKLRTTALSFKTISDDALLHSREENGERSTEELALKLALIAKDFGAMSAGAITRKDIQDWLLEQTEERDWSPATRNRYQAAFSLVFRVAVDNEKLDGNPASKIKRKPEHNDRIRFLSPDEEKKLTGIISERWRHYLPAFLFSIHIGCRASEQWGLQWSDINLRQKIVTFHKTKPGKTRHVPLNAIALEALAELGRRSGHQSFVFLNTDGGQIRSARDWFEPASAVLKDYTWHCNRHTFASRLVMAGVDIRTVAYLMGHATIQMTMRYAHLAPDHNREAVDRLVSQNGLVTKSVTGTKSKKRVGNLKPAQVVEINAL